jgi:hypothetical protein
VFAAIDASVPETGDAAVTAESNINRQTCTTANESNENYSGIIRSILPPSTPKYK